MATDVVIERDGRLAELSPLTMKRLDAVLPSTWSKGNPVDIVSDASAQRYALAMEAIPDDDQANALLVLNCPIAVVSGTDAAIAVAETSKKRQKMPKLPILLTSWLGEETASGARRIFFGTAHPLLLDPDRRGAGVHAHGALPEKPADAHGDGPQHSRSLLPRRGGHHRGHRRCAGRGSPMALRF